jgi:hypothetical protein
MLLQLQRLNGVKGCGRTKNGEHVTIWKEAEVALLRYCPILAREA